LPTEPATPALTSPAVEKEDKTLKFHFAPNMKPLLFPADESLPDGTDAWAFAKGWVSVTPLRAEFAGMGDAGFGSETGGVEAGRVWSKI
jgi:tubulin--tyrosine ligase